MVNELSLQIFKVMRSIKVMLDLKSSVHFKAILVLSILLGGHLSFANAPKVGKTAAAKYFQKNGDTAAPVRYAASEVLDSGDRFLALGLSGYTKSDSYEWGGVGDESNVAKLGVDLNYRLSSYNNLLDYSLRISYNQFEPAGQKASKLSFLYAMTFPDAGSQFPLYFGGALGGGVFLTQLSGESPLTLDYQLFLGLRIFDLFERTGLYVEGGLKNHVQLTSNGQLNGTYVAAGAIFTF
jgi:hypothetical protein